jgi:hypothetical protein
VRAEGRFSSQPGILIRTRGKLTIHQRVTSQQDEGQSIGAVTWQHKAERAARELEVCAGAAPSHMCG